MQTELDILVEEKQKLIILCQVQSFLCFNIDTHTTTTAAAATITTSHFYQPFSHEAQDNVM